MNVPQRKCAQSVNGSSRNNGSSWININAAHVELSVIIQEILPVAKIVAGEPRRELVPMKNDFFFEQITTLAKFQSQINISCGSDYVAKIIEYFTIGHWS